MYVGPKILRQQLGVHLHIMAIYCMYNWLYLATNSVMFYIKLRQPMGVTYKECSSLTMIRRHKPHTIQPSNCHARLQLLKPLPSIINSSKKQKPCTKVQHFIYIYTIKYPIYISSYWLMDRP